MVVKFLGREIIDKFIFFKFEENTVMIITIKSGEEASNIQRILNDISEALTIKKDKKKRKILSNTFGKVKLHPTKSPIDIQRELRDEWN